MLSPTLACTAGKKGQWSVFFLEAVVSLIRATKSETILMVIALAKLSGIGYGLTKRACFSVRNKVWNLHIFCLEKG